MGAGRFLYGLALGISLGIIGSKLLGAASPGPHRQVARKGRARPALHAAARERKRERAAAR